MSDPDVLSFPLLLDEHDVGLDDPRIESWMVRDDGPAVDERVWVLLEPESVPLYPLDVRREGASPLSTTVALTLPVSSGTPQGQSLGWLTVEQAAPLLSLTAGALSKRLARAARRTRDGVQAVLDGVEARKFGRLWRVYVPATWRRG